MNNNLLLGKRPPVAKFLLPCIAVASFLTAPAAFGQSVALVVNHNAIPETANGLAGGDFSYAPLVSLNSDGPATNVKLTQVLPLGVRLNSITFDPEASGSCSAAAMPFMVSEANQTIQCDLSDIADKGSANGIRALFNVTIPEAGTKWTAVVSASADGVDPNDPAYRDLPRNITTNKAADLGVELIGPTGTVKQFTPFDYTIKVTNHGPSEIPDGGQAVVQFTVPPSSVAGATPAGTGWTCAPNGGAAGTVMSCSYSGPLARGGMAPDLKIPVTPLASGELDATATVAGKDLGGTDFPDAVSANNTDETSINVEPDNVVNVSVQKAASPTTIDQANPANEVTYTITPKRVSGNDVPSNVVIRDELPAAIQSYTITPSSDWNCDASTTAPNVISCQFVGTANPGVGADYTALEFKAIIDGSVGGTVRNTVGVRASNEDENAVFDNEATATVSISNAVSLNLNKSPSKSPIKAGESFNWRLRVSNPASGSLPVRTGQTITVVDVIPEGMTITGFSNDASTNPPSQGWGCESSAAGGGFPIDGPATVTCTNDTGLATGASSTVLLHSRGSFGGEGSFRPVSNTASLNGVSGRDPFTPVSNSATVNVSEHQVDIGITKTASPPVVKSGDEVTYTLTVRNHSAEHPSTGIVVTDVLNNLVTSQMGCEFDTTGACKPGTQRWPNGGFISAEFTSGAGTCGPNGNANSPSRTVTCNIPTLAANGTAVIEIKARHYAPNANGSNAALSNPNTARIRSNEVEDTNRDNDSNEAPLSVTPVADLQVFKDPKPSPAAIGEPVIYTVHVHNAGPSAAAAVRLKDALPENAHWIASGFNPNTATCDPIADDAVGAELNCTWANPLPVNGQYAITYGLRSSPDAKVDDILSNTVDVKTTTPELTEENNRAEAEVTLKPAELDVVINMEHTDDALVLGDPTIYTITVTNSGPSYATQVKMTDVFPSSLLIGDQEFPSSAVFSFDGVTELNSRVGDGTPVDLISSLATLCEKPDDGAETTTPLQLACIFDKLAPNETVTIKFKMTATQLPEGRATGTIFHNAKVEIHEDEFLVNGSDVDFNNVTTDRTSARRTADTPVPEVADLGLTKEADSEEELDSPALNAGDPLVYTLTVTNYGPEDSSGSQIRDILPEGLDYVASPGCEFIVESRTITCEVGPLTEGESQVFTIDTTIANPYKGRPWLENEAEVIAEGDPNPSNNRDRTRTKVFKPVEAVPTLSEWGLILMSVLIGLIMLGMRRRQMR